MSIQFTASGKDDLATFAVLVPGHCKACNKDTDVILRYHSSQLIASLKKKLNLEDVKLVPSLLILVNGKVSEIGVTCGCYAKFQRQVAYISRQRESKTKRG